MTHMPLDVSTLPSRRDEAWKWTDLRGTVGQAASGLSKICVPKFDVPNGVQISQGEVCKGEGHKNDSPMGNIAATFATQSWDIHVPAGVKPTQALNIEDLAGGHGRIAIRVDKGARLDLVDYHGDMAGGFTNIDICVHLAEGAELSRILIHADNGHVDNSDSVRVVTTRVTMEAGANFTQHSLSFGGALSRFETRVYGEGADVEAQIHGAYLLNGKRHTDMTSHIELSAPNAKIRQSVKGVVTDQARGVFQGKFHVERPAQKTDAEMRHDGLMLSETSHIRAKPELEIYADDVECAHGNTIGALDESALFYMRQRGIPLAKAKALLIEAFVTGVFDGVSDESLRESVIGKVRSWLEINA